MIKFKDFIKKNPIESILSWDGSFAAIRDKIPESILSWKSSNQEAKNLQNDSRDSKTSKDSDEDLTEGLVVAPKDKEWVEDTGSEKLNSIGAKYDVVHDHPDIKPTALSKDHIEAIKHYTETKSVDKDGWGSSHNLNAYLRNRSDSSNRPKHQTEHHEPEQVEKGVQRLSSAFTPKNTNNTPIRTYSGIPPSVGERLRKSKVGTRHTLAGFTSTSTSVSTAQEFAFQHAENEEEMFPHMLICHVEKGAGLSLAHHSAHPEHEILLHHGAHITYRGSETDEDEDGNETHYHHVTVHPTHKPLEEYGPYKSTGGK